MWKNRCHWLCKREFGIASLQADCAALAGVKSIIASRLFAEKDRLQETDSRASKACCTCHHRL
jgi:hypothetical protein